MENTTSNLTLQPGEMLNWYELKRVLGRGGFGVTYLAHDTNLHTEVAIKEFLPDVICHRNQDNSVCAVYEEDQSAFHLGLTNFLKEARILYQFNHPNIVRVLAVFETNNTAYMVMQYENGLDLKQLLFKTKSLDEITLKRLVVPIIDGLSEVHKCGFIHRDIKPANIYIRQDQSPVLIDFGSARVAKTDVSQNLTSLYTPGYAPFEQYGDSPVSQQGPWTDIYALAAVIYYAITGNAPVDSTLRASALLNEKPDPMPSICSIGQGRYSSEFLEAIDWALCTRVSDRPQSLQEWLICLMKSDHTLLKSPSNPAQNASSGKFPKTKLHTEKQEESVTPVIQPPITKQREALKQADEELYSDDPWHNQRTAHNSTFTKERKSLASRLRWPAWALFAMMSVAFGGYLVNGSLGVAPSHYVVNTADPDSLEIKPADNSDTEATTTQDHKTTAEHQAEVETQERRKDQAVKRAALEAQKKREAEQRAELEAQKRREARAEQQAEFEAEEKRKAQAAQQAELKAEEKRKAQAAQQAELEAEEKRKAQAAQQAELEAEEKRKAQAAQQAELEAEEKRKAQAAQQAELEAEEKRKAQAKQQAELEAEEKRKAQAAQQAELEAEEERKAQAEQQAELEAQERRKAEVEQQAVLETKKKLEARTKQKVEVEAQNISENELHQQGIHENWEIASTEQADTDQSNSIVDELVASISKNIADNNLTTPEGDNANDHINELERINSTNPIVKQQRELIVNRFAFWTENALSEGDNATAERYMTALERIPGTDAVLRKLRTEMRLQLGTETDSQSNSETDIPWDGVIDYGDACKKPSFFKRISARGAVTRKTRRGNKKDVPYSSSSKLNIDDGPFYAYIVIDNLTIRTYEFLSRIYDSQGKVIYSSSNQIKSKSLSDGWTVWWNYSPKSTDKQGEWTFLVCESGYRQLEKKFDTYR